MIDAACRSLLVRLAARTLGLLEREYPNGLRLDLTGPLDHVSPRALHPAFYGCYDWHSAVHSVWQVVRVLRVTADDPDPDLVRATRDVLDRLLTTETIGTELAWVEPRPSFEMPYGMAWVLQLADELGRWDDDRGRTWAAAVHPLAALARERFARRCDRWTAPVRGGLHQQTAFSLGLVWDSVPSLRPTVERAARGCFAADTDVDLRTEPSASDFLSPALAEADLMRRVLDAAEFEAWLAAFAPRGFAALRPVVVVDPSDGQLAHWAGLNLSRSWMLAAVADSLPAEHGLTSELHAAAAAHLEAGLATCDHDDYMISHWVPTFAVYALTRELSRAG